MQRSTSARTLGLELLAWSLIGSGATRLVTPSRHASRWAIGPFRRPALWARSRPLLLRLTGVVRVALGLWLIRRLPAR